MCAKVNVIMIRHRCRESRRSSVIRGWGVGIRGWGLQIGGSRSRLLRWVDVNESHHSILPLRALTVHHAVGSGAHGVVPERGKDILVVDDLRRPTPHRLPQGRVRCHSLENGVLVPHCCIIFRPIGVKNAIKTNTDSITTDYPRALLPEEHDVCAWCARRDGDRAAAADTRCIVYQWRRVIDGDVDEDRKTNLRL